MDYLLVGVILFTDLAAGCGPRCVTIGAVVNGTNHVSTEDISQHGYQVSVVKHHIDIDELFLIYSAVRTLDATENVDVIIVFDYDPAVLKSDRILLTENKKLLKWGGRQTVNQEVDTGSKTFVSPSDICGADVIPAELQFPDLYCKTDLNTTVQNRDANVITLLGPQAVTALVTELKWKTVIILYEDSTEIETTDLVDKLSEKRVLFAMFNIDHVTDLHALLQEIYHTKVPFNKDLNIVVLCKFFCARKIFRTANEFDASNTNKKTLLKQFSRWLVVVYGHTEGVSRALQACADDLDNVAIIAFPEISGSVTEEFNKTLWRILADTIREDFLNNQTDIKKSIINKLEESALSFSPHNKCLAYNIDTLLWTKNGRMFSSVGYVEINGNVVLKSDVFPNTKYGYNMRMFNVSTLPYPPFVIKKEENNTVVYEGFCMDLLKEMAYQLNFTYQLTEPEDGLWGSIKNPETFSFNGLVGQLQRQEVDMVAAPISSEAARSRAVDFTFPFYYEYTTVIVKKPNVNATKWRTLLDPFKWEVLISIGAALPCVTILGFLMEKYNPYYNVPEHAQERQRNGGLHTWHSSFWYMYGALLCQGGVHLPDSMSGRTLVSAWWLVCIILVGIYTGNLIAFLTVTKEKPPFNTLEELSKMKGSYKWGTLAGTHWDIVFMTSNVSTYKAIGDGIREFNKSDPSVLNTDTEVHLRKVKEGGYAWIGDKTTIDTALATECNLMSIKEEFMPMKYAFGFAKNSPHTAIFSAYMMQIQEGGLMQIWKRKWWPKANFCAGSIVTESKPISLMDVQSAFYVCFIGIFLGLMAFIVEFIVYKCRVYRAKRKELPNR